MEDALLIVMSNVMTQDNVIDHIIYVMDILIADMEMMKKIVVMYITLCIYA